MASNLEAWLLGSFRGVGPKHLQRYLDELTDRFSRRSLADRLFFDVTRRAVEGEAAHLPPTNRGASQMGTWLNRSGLPPPGRLPASPKRVN